MTDLMQGEMTLRQLAPQDGPDYATLLTRSPDTGRVGVAVRFEIDPYQALISLHGDVVGVVAETAGYEGFVGAGLVKCGPSQWAGSVCPSALLNTLVVHPDFRRRGVASQLAQWRRNYAQERFGEEGVAWAAIQRNNTGSELAAKKWATEFLADRLAFIPTKVRTTPPPIERQYVVRPIEPGELKAAAERQNQYYRDYDLYPPDTDTSLAGWLSATPFDTPMRHYWVVTDLSGNLLAGLAATENYRARSAVVTRMPGTLRFLNRFLKVVPPDGALRELAISRVWHAPGQIRAARYLLESVKWAWRDRATSLMLYADVRSPLMEVYGVRPWTMKTFASLALRGPGQRAQDRLCYYVG